MPRLAAQRRPQAEQRCPQTRREAADASGLFTRAPVVAPRRHDQRRLAQRRGDRGLVAWADGIVDAPQGLGAGRTPREEIDDVDAAEAPGSGEADAAADGGIEHACVRGARIEHDEGHAPRRRLPLAAQVVAIAARLVEACRADHEAGRPGHDARRSRPMAVTFDGSFGSASATPELRPPGPGRRGSRTPTAGSSVGGNASVIRRRSLAASAFKYANIDDSWESHR